MSKILHVSEAYGAKNNLKQLKEIYKENIMTEEQIKEANSYSWWHQIKLTDTYVTPGICNHGTGKDVETRFGLPTRMDNMRVLDIGGWDGLFSFEAEKRGAKTITMIDIYQLYNHIGFAEGIEKGNKPFQFAKKILNSKAEFLPESLESLVAWSDSATKFDYIFYFGVLYHIENPLGAVKKLSHLIAPGGVVLVETTISKTTTVPSLEYRPGFAGDSTNQFYPNVEWVQEAFKQNGAKSSEILFNNGSRASFKIQF